MKKLKKTTKKTTKTTVRKTATTSFTSSKPFTTVYIGNLDYDRDDRDIKELFSRYGKVRKAEVVIDPETERSKGIAFVQMPNEDEALEAIEGLNGLRFDNRTLKVSIANDRFASIDAERAQKKMAGEKKAEGPKVDKARGRTERRRDKKTGLDKLMSYLKSKKS